MHASWSPAAPFTVTQIIETVREVERIVPDLEKEARLEERAMSAEQKLIFDRLARLPPHARLSYLDRVEREVAHN